MRLVLLREPSEVVVHVLDLVDHASAPYAGVVVAGNLHHDPPDDVACADPADRHVDAWASQLRQPAIPIRYCRPTPPATIRGKGRLAQKVRTADERA
jgi:hypothetical protein